MKNVLLCDIKPFIKCNLACNFCHEHHRRIRENPTIAVYKPDYIINYFQKAYAVIDNLINRVDYDLIRMSFMGGELFQDVISDASVNQYHIFFQKLETLCQQHQIKLHAQLVTNLVYKKIDRLIDFVKTHATSVQTSFDFHGRYTKQHMADLFVNNVYKLRDNGINTTIAIVLHQQNIKTLIDQQGPFYNIFKNLYDDGFRFAAVQYYNNCSINSPLYVSADMLYKAYQQLMILYPDFVEFANIRARLSDHKIQVHYSGEIHSISIVDKKIRYRNVTERETNYANQHCVICPYYKCCSTSGIFKQDTTNQYLKDYPCFDKILFEKIDEQHY